MLLMCGVDWTPDTGMNVLLRRFLDFQQKFRDVWTMPYVVIPTPND